VEVSDKEISEIKINSVLTNTKGLCKNTKTIVRLRFSYYRGIFTSIYTRLYYIPPTFGIRLKYKLKIVIMALFVATKLQPYNSTALQLYSPTALQLDSSTTLQLSLQPYNSTALRLYNSTSTTLQIYSPTTYSAALEL
jgi:hypothetical protein